MYKEEKFILADLSSEKSKIEVPAGLVSDEGCSLLTFRGGEDSVLTRWKGKQGRELLFHLKSFC